MALSIIEAFRLAPSIRQKNYNFWWENRERYSYDIVYDFSLDDICVIQTDLLDGKRQEIPFLR